MRRIRIAAVLAIACTVGCRGDEDAPSPTPSKTPARAAAPAVVLHPTRDPSGALVVRHGSQLATAEVADAGALDLALSTSDQVGHLAELDAATACDDVDLIALAERAPKLTRLRISGCPTAIHAGLSAFGSRLRELTLADIELDGVTIGNIAALPGLQTLRLSRVTLGHDSLKPLRVLSLQEVQLRDLDRDSDISTMLDLWPRSLTRVTLDGSWAGHNAMLTLGRAEALEKLELRGTRIANFSLHQIKGLEHLREIVLEGDTFNDKTPLHFRDLPVERFVCDCARFGDVGLRHLRHATQLRTLELRDTEITGAGLEEIDDLQRLEELVLLDRDLGPEGFSALAVLPELRRLELSGPVEDPAMTKLGLLTNLETLRLHSPSVDDSAATELAKLVHLRILDLRDSKLSDAGLSSLRDLTDLRELYLDGTRVTRDGLDAVAQLPNLEVLGLDRTDVVDAGIAALKGHPALRELRLDGTLVTDATVDVLLSMPKLQRVSLARTVVSRAAVARLEKHPTLEALNLDGIRG